jgi:L-phenylalanine/L-methionine N-acetyltransferase
MPDPTLTADEPITLRSVTPDDAAAFARMLGEPEVMFNTLQGPYPTEQRWKARLTEPIAPGSNDLSLVAERAGQVIGSAGLFSPGPNVRRRHVSWLGISVVTAAQGQGVGTALMRALCDYADRWGQILRIELTVFTDNARAIALYERFGFEREGIHRAYALRDGVYADVLSMARLHPQPPSIRPQP